MEKMIKYPRTQHVEGSRLQQGDEDLSQISFGQIKGRHLVIEEKIDGANCAISFSAEGQLLLQSRGHYLTGGYRERHYNLLKTWATIHSYELYQILGSRYIMYGEWMYAKHKIYYDNLPSYFMEFDIFDKQTEVFLDTESRRIMLEGSCVCSVPVLAEGEFSSMEQVLSYLKNSLYKTENCHDNLVATLESLGLDVDSNLAQTDESNLMEGLYLKVEEDGIVADRMKFVRYGFVQTDTSSTTRWIDRTIIPNKLAEGKRFV